MDGAPNEGVGLRPHRSGGRHGLDCDLVPDGIGTHGRDLSLRRGGLGAGGGDLGVVVARGQAEGADERQERAWSRK